MAVLRPEEIEFHTANQDLVLDNVWLVLEVLHEVGHQLVCIIYGLNILSDNPYDRSFCLRIIEVVKVLANVTQQSLVFARVFPEYVSDDDDRFLHHIGNLGLEGLPQALHALISHFL